MVSAMQIACFVMHLVASVQFIFAVFYDWNYVIIPLDVQAMGSGFGGKFVFLTFWDAILQCVYFSICVINDIAGNTEDNPDHPPVIRKIRDYIFASIGFPIAMFVGVTFWALMAINRELVLPEKLDAFFPLWLNHIMHTSIVVFVLLEMLLVCHKYPSRKIGLIGLTIFMLTYLSWTFIIFYNTDLWVYPVMNVMNWPSRISFLLAMLGFCCLLYLVGDFINLKRWGELLHPKKGKTDIPNPDETLPITDIHLNEASV